jgi:periplasmic protein TonB
MSQATNPRAYRADAAHHIYALNHDKIWKGRMPPLLYAIGVLQVEVDSQGYVKNLNWMRAPKHAPEVMAQIEKTVRDAAPFPAPARMGKVVYTDTWLWHKSGRFQLDTLTEGQD